MEKRNGSGFETSPSKRVRRRNHNLKQLDFHLPNKQQKKKPSRNESLFSEESPPTRSLVQELRDGQQNSLIKQAGKDEQKNDYELTHNDKPKSPSNGDVSFLNRSLDEDEARLVDGILGESSKPIVTDDFLIPDDIDHSILMSPEFGPKTDDIPMTPILPASLDSPENTVEEYDYWREVCPELDEPGTSQQSAISQAPFKLPKKNTVTPINNAQNQTPIIPQRTRLQAINNATPLNSSVCHNKSSSDDPFSTLPSLVRQAYQKKGITQLYPWQKEVLNLSGEKQRKSLIFSQPTSAGKSLVAEILALKCCHIEKKSVLFVLPFVSIVMERADFYDQLCSPLKIRLESYYGSMGMFPVSKENSFFIATIEKASSIINSLIEEKRTHELGLIVVDELHMLGIDAERGPRLELLLTKIKHFCPQTKICGMSATLPNLNEIAEWLNAVPYQGTFRPTELQQRMCVVRTDSTSIFDENGRLVTDHSLKPDLSESKPDSQSSSKKKYRKTDKSKHISTTKVLQKICATLDIRHSMIVFCPTKQSEGLKKWGYLFNTILMKLVVQNCSDIARQICTFLPPEHKNHKSALKGLAINILHKETNGIDPTLKKTIPWGVVFHHGGLTVEERRHIEAAYRAKVVRIICCTSTLAAGVNLPARKVVIRSPHVGRDFLSVTQYRQMCGRAGRTGQDERGESVLIVSEPQEELGKTLMTAKLESCNSKLGHTLSVNAKTHQEVTEGHAVCRLVLEAICLGAVDVKTYANSTLFGRERTSNEELYESLNHALNLLSESNLIERGGMNQFESTPDSQRLCCQPWQPTSLGQASFKANLSIHETQCVYSELEHARHDLCLADDLHLCYLLSPVNETSLPRVDWQLLRYIFTQLSTTRHHIAALVGARESYVDRRARGGTVLDSDAKTDRAVRKFFCALILDELINEVPVKKIAEHFHVPRGLVQQLMVTAGSFAYTMQMFCEALGWTGFQAVIKEYSKRVNVGVRSEILPLVEIPHVTRLRARALYGCGYRTVEEIASADPQKIGMKVNLGPFPTRTAGLIVSSARKLLQKRAEELDKQAALCKAALSHS